VQTAKREKTEMMRHKTAILLVQIGFALGLMGSSPALAVTEQDFYAKSTGNLVNLCSAKPSDPLYTAAVNFCEGFVIGAYQYHQLSAQAEGRQPLVCPPSPMPSRDESISRFVDWAGSHQAALSTQPVEGVFEFLAQTFPCRS
jgi:hypothetical protein